ncbi:Levanase precursor [compost metagenome]
MQLKKYQLLACFVLLIQAMSVKAQVGNTMTVAGKGENGYTNGVKANARFSNPIDIAFDKNGNAYVTEDGTKCIRKISAFGDVTLFAGANNSKTGLEDGFGAAARFTTPLGIAVHPITGDIYVADANRIRKISPTGLVSTFAGAENNAVGYADGSPAHAKFNYLSDIAIDDDGNIYVADRNNNRIRKYTAATNTFTTIAGSSAGFADGNGAQAQFKGPTQLAVDANGNVFVSDRGNFRIRKITSKGVVTTIAGNGSNVSSDGNGNSAGMSDPFGIAVAQDGNIYVSEYNRHAIRKIDTKGNVSTLSGGAEFGLADGIGTKAKLKNPAGIIAAADGNLYFVERANATVRTVLLSDSKTKPLMAAYNATIDYTSKVPQATFSNTLAAQEKELKNDPLLKRFAKSRQDLAVDKHRPFYHFISPEGRLNDPNGLSYWKGNWHLFYQAYPPEDPRQHWGHAVSKDLINWKDLPHAIYPNPEKQVYSGSAFVEENRVIAMYHGTEVGSMVAVSDDPLLLNWKKLNDGKPVIALPKPGEKLPYNVFDPFVWKKDGMYYTVLAGVRPVGPGGKNMRAEFLFKSSDLLKWEYMHPFLENDTYGLAGDDGACPYFWPIGDKGKYILVHFSHKSGGKYLIGDYDQKRDKFVVTDGGNFNHGPVGNGGVHAPSAYPDGKGGVVVIFNMNSGKPNGGNSFTEMMSLPRLLTLDSRGKLAQQPVGDLASLRTDKVEQQNVVLPANKEVVFNKIQGDAMEINLEIDLKKSASFELNVLRSPDKEEYTRIIFYKDGGYPDREYPGKPERASAIAIDNSNSSILANVRPRITETGDVWLEKNETVKLRIFIDKSIVEVFANDKQCLSVRTYPGRDDSKGVSITAKGNEALLKSIQAWQMKSIY